VRQGTRSRTKCGWIEFARRSASRRRLIFNADKFRSKAADCAKQADKAAVPSEIRDLRRLEQSFLSLAQNEEWLAGNLDKIIRSQDGRAAEYPSEKINGRTATEIEEHILRCLGAAVMLQWATIPATLQRNLFDTAGSMGELLRTPELRGQIARFLHHHNEAEDKVR
jgi:hypothetical protein